jgi:two-component system sensor histidine kinase CpxA
MKSVYLRILLWFVATLAVSLLAFSMVSRFVESRAAGKGGPFARFDALILQEAIGAYELGGPPKLAAYLQTVDTSLAQQRFLTDPQGRDLANGADRSNLLALLHSKWAAPIPIAGHMVVALASPDDRYRLIAVIDPPFGRWTLVPYYALIFAAVALVCWALAMSIASPLRDLARGVERFGRGELSVRLNSNRKDEIGELARTFDRMAERIGTLLTAERRLLQDVSHELRSPLARMSFAVELARRDENREPAISRIKSEIERLSGLVASLVEVTRSEGDPLTRENESFPLADLLRDIAEDCWIETDARHCWVMVDAADNPSMLGDRELLRRAFENIVRNAVRYAPGESQVEIHLETTEQSVLITVRDYGVGVPEELLSKLGQPFFRVDDSRDSATGGIGLGLAIAKRAIAVHHGSLLLENARPGLKVSVELPLREPECRSERSPAPAKAGRSI